MPKNKLTKIKMDETDLIAIKGRHAGNPGTPRDKYANSVTDEQILDAIEQTHGLIPDIALIIGMTNTGCRNRIHNDPVLMEACNKARDSIVLIAESKMFAMVHAGDFKAVQFVLKCLGKHRGWSEESTINIKSAINPEEAKRQVADIFSLSTKELSEDDSSVTEGV